MYAHRRSTFEALEPRRALAVSATVTDGDLVITGDADGAVEIVAVGDGSYQVTDNGVLIADETTLTGVTDDIRIDIDEFAGADNSVLLDLSAQTTQTVDRIYADLGDGDNSLQLVGGIAESLQYRGGEMDGFIDAFKKQDRDLKTSQAVMGYYTDADIPFYWNLADQFVLFDHFFSSGHGGSVQNHLYWVAAAPGSAAEQIPPQGWGDLPTIFDRLEAKYKGQVR